MKNHPELLVMAISSFTLVMGNFLRQLVIEKRARQFGQPDFCDRSFRTTKLSYLLPTFHIGVGTAVLAYSRSRPDILYLLCALGIVFMSMGMFLLYADLTTEVCFEAGHVTYRNGRKVVWEIRLTEIKSVGFRAGLFEIEMMDGKKFMLTTALKENGLVLAMLRRYRPQ